MVLESAQIKVRTEGRIIQVNWSIGLWEEHTATLRNEGFQRFSNQIKRKTESLELIIPARRPFGHEWLDHHCTTTVGRQLAFPGHRGG
jgi:hypothetical protein